MNDINNYSLLFSNLQKYKSKVDYFLNYDIIKKNQNNESESDSEEIDEDEDKKNKKKEENGTKKKENQKNILKKREENENLLKQIEESSSSLFRKNFGINSLNEKYSSITNNLISKLNNIDSEVEKITKLKIMGSICDTTYILKKKILDVENQINNLEEIIGNFDFTNHKDTIFGKLKYFMKMNLNLETNKDWIKDRFKNSKIFEEMLSAFNKDSDNKKYLNLFKQICEEYMIYLTMEKYKDVISYLKKRLTGIKNIILNSEQFEYDINELNKLINENEKKYEILKYKYLQTLGSFDKLDNILKEINNLDNSIKNKI